jgi:hypothetical protein
MVGQSEGIQTPAGIVLTDDRNVPRRRNWLLWRVVCRGVIPKRDHSDAVYAVPRKRASYMVAPDNDLVIRSERLKDLSIVVARPNRVIRVVIENRPAQGPAQSFNPLPRNEPALRDDNEVWLRCKDAVSKRS